MAVAAGIIGMALAFAIACGNWAIPNDTAILQPTDTPLPQPITIVAPTPTLNPTVEAQKSIDAVLYIVDNEWRIKGPDVAMFCQGRYSLERAYVLRIDLAGFTGRVADGGYVGTPEWHTEILRLAEELEDVLAKITRYCYKP